MLREILQTQASKEWRINALDHQQTPVGDDWTTWLILGGRGCGKTRAGAEWVRAIVNGRTDDRGAPYQKARAIALVAETYADAREVMIDGPSGIVACAAGASRPTYEASRRRVVWPNGAVAHCFSAEDPDGIRGYQFDAAWSDAEIDFIGVDNYMPMADWRDGFGHLDALAGARGQHDVDYLKLNIDGGEGFDWYYASDADRNAQIRTPITDGAYGEPWIYRCKDLWSWWSNAHHNRPGGVRDAAPTSWVPESKRIVFTETGAPAVDKGANQPNVFVDPKSSESAVPYYSTGPRDDMAQRRFLEAQGAFWADPANNPVSAVYGAPMVDAGRRYVYAYDARPFPDFPARTDVWGDGANWETGHWLNGRLGRAPLDLLVEALGQEAGFADIDASALSGVVTGYLIDRPLSPREMIDPLADVFQFDVVETGGSLRCQRRNAEKTLAIDFGDLAERDEGAFSLSLAQETDLPAAFRLGFFDEAEDFAPAVTEARDPRADPFREVGIDIAAVIPAAEAEARARSVLADAWVMREQLSFSLPPSALDLEPGDTVALTSLGAERLYRITDIEDRNDRRADLVRVAPSVYESPVGPTQFSTPAPVPVFGAPVWELFELPPIEGTDAAAPWFAAFADPWPGGAALYRGGGETTPILSGLAPARAVIGRLKTALGPAGSGRWTGQRIDVDLSFGTLASKPEENVLAGANLCAIESDDGAWELAQFQHAELQGDGSWRLSGFLRGQAGSEAAALAGASVGARFILLNRSVTQAAFSADLRGLSFDWQAGPEKDIPDTENFTSKPIAFETRGLKPLSPVHLRAGREGGDLRLSWIRRTRAGGDSWEGEVPLSEQSERYVVTIYDGATPLREVETTTPDCLYESAAIAADFGPAGPGASLAFSVAQISDAVGAGNTTIRSVSVL